MNTGPQPRLPVTDELLVLLAAADTAGTAALCAGLLREGLSMADLVDRGLAPAMRDVGSLWEAGVWSTADEHAATAAVERGLSAAPVLTSASGAEEVVVAAAEGDWHGLAPRMVADALSDVGWQVRLLGAAVPTEILVHDVQARHPRAVLLSCSVPTCLPQLMQSVTRLQDLDVPVYVGGAALGADGRRAAALGADGWAGDARGAQALVAALPRRSRPDSTGLRLHRHALRAERLTGWLADAACVLGDPIAVEWLEWLAAVASVALLLDHDPLVEDQLAWMLRMEQGQGRAGLTHRIVDTLVMTCPGCDGALTEMLTLIVGELTVLELSRRRPD